MTTMTEDVAEVAPGRPSAARRPTSGIAIDPVRLIQLRERHALSRQDLADKITARSAAVLGGILGCDPGDLYDPADLTGDTGLGVLSRDRVRAAAAAAGLTWETLIARLTADYPDVLILGLSRDTVTKNENGLRRPKARTLRALCWALDCEARELMPGSRRGPAPVTLAGTYRNSRRFNEGMREFAEEHQLPYRNASGRLYYTKPLRDAYAVAVAGADEEAVAAAVTAAREAIAAMIAASALGVSGGGGNTDSLTAAADEPDPEELDAMHAERGRGRASRRPGRSRPAADGANGQQPAA